MPQIERIVEIRAPLQRVFEFVTDIRNHGRLSPPETREELIDAGDVPLRLGTAVTLRARYGGIRWTLTSRIVAFDPPHPLHPDRAYFRDEQIRGPFATWVHEHWFEVTPTGHTRQTDRFDYAAPLGPLGRLVEQIWLNRRMRYLMIHLQTMEKQILESDG